MNASMPDPGPPDQSEKEIKRAVFGEQVTLAYHLTPPTLLASLVPSIVMWRLALSILPGAAATWWFALTVFVTLGRYVLVLIHHRSMEAREHPELWARFYVAGSLAAGLLWGYAGVAFFPVEHPVYEGIVVGILVGVAAGGLSSLGAILSSFVAYLVPTVLPFGITMICLGDYGHVLLGILGLVFIGIMWLNASRVNRSIVENISSRLRQARMAEEVLSAQQRTEEANAQLRAEIAEREDREGTRNCQGCRGKSQPGQVPVSRQHESRDPDPHERRHRHDRPSSGRRFAL